MLPLQLLRARRSGRKLILKFCSGRDIELELAEELISVFRKHVGRKVGELERELEDIEERYEGMGVDFKLVRGLSTLLERKCDVETKETKVKPDQIRRIVFERAAKLGGFVIDEREEVLKAIAEELKIDPSEIEELMWADWDENKEIKSFNEPTAADLLREYNQSLLQTALFRAIRMELFVRGESGKIKLLIRDIKAKGLMYYAESLKNGIRFLIDGPASVLKLTTRYGTSLAKLVPTIISMDSWRIVADIRMRKPLILDLSDSLRNLFPAHEITTVEYDSSLERQFHEIAASSGWEVIREPYPIVSGGSVFFPDFLIKKGDVKLLVEIIGFWTHDYIKKKLQKMKQVSDKMLLLVDRNLSCSRFFEELGDVLYFDGKIKYAELAKKLSEVEKMMRKEAEVLPLDIGDISSLDEISSRLGFEKSVLIEKLRKKVPAGYIFTGNLLLKENILKEVKSVIESCERRDLRSISDLLSEKGIPERYHTALIEAAGFKVIFRGLDESKAEVI
jgi:predicted nuclease of restriction endonuclease-like RecB superfamily